MNEWNIQSRSHGCQACGKPFADKQPFHTLLSEDRQLYLRQDICQSCWHSQYSEGASDRKGFVSYWQGVYAAPVPRVEAIQKENAESLLRKLIELNDPRYIPAGYILAVMLERKRLLKIKEQIVRDGQRVFIYEQPGTGDIFTIIDPALQLNQLEQVQHDVAALLEHGLNPPVQTPAPAGTEAAPTAPAADVPMPAAECGAPAASEEPQTS